MPTPIKTEIGDIYPVFKDGKLVTLSWAEVDSNAHGNELVLFADQLHHYLKGHLNKFTYPVEFKNGTDLQKRVWQELLNVPYGETITYSELADRVASHARPVANAVGKNPIPILVPCHRILAKNGLGGYSGGCGVETKKFLLNLEKNNK